MIKNIAIIGLGLIGGSLSRALKAANIAEKIVAYDINPDSLQFALNQQWIDESYTTINDAITHSEIIFICTPPNQFTKTLTHIKPFLQTTTIISDCISVKQHIIEQAKEILGSLFVNFVPGHPMAGSEQNGIAHAKMNLFHERTVILSPEAGTHEKSLNQIKTIWLKLGAKIIVMTGQEHDQIVAYTSHLPHLLSFAFINSLDEKNQNLIKQCTGKGFEDFTRIAAANPELWTDILIENKDYLLQQLKIFKQQLLELENNINNNNSSELLAIISAASNLKKKFS